MMEWDLSQLYSSFQSEEYHKGFKLLEEMIEDLLLWSEKELASVEDAPEKVRVFLEKYIAITEKSANLGYFAFLTMSVEADNEYASKYADNLQVLSSRLTPAMVRFDRFLTSLDNFDEVLKTDIAKKHEYWLRKRLEHAKRLLSEQEEELIAQMKTTGGYSWNRLRGKVTAKLTGKIEVDGEEKELSINTLRNMAYDKDPEVRKRAYEAELNAYRKVEDAVASALNSIKGEYLIIIKKRGYSTPLEATLENMHLDRDTFETVMGVIKENLPAFRKYLRHKAKLLGYENGLPWYDLFAPIGKFEKTYTIDEAKEFILSVFKEFDEELYSLANRAFEEKWIDFTPRKGKRGGAFCARLHTVKQSRIMANFDGSFDGITTLAHELGHAFHNYNQ
ncbi:MAG TPA: oligoendopeptidase F, partial [Candidatus Atribacteria bacterium]|nr:oligoendopeptidase F [Candidatus Atribacteria bacterium]